jgi:hypothetical protein
MGIMSTRADTVAVWRVLFCVPVCGIADVCPNLPPQQPADHQIQIRGEIGLARVRGRSVCAHHKKATARKRLKVPAHKLTKAPLNPVSRHGRADGPADHKSYPGWLPVMDTVRTDQQVTHDEGPPGARPGAYG